MKKINNKGMTLVEIIIVLVIASLTMVITGGILVNSLGYFDTSTKTSLDKQATDGIMDYISDEIQYATDVRISDGVPDDRSWHVIHVENGKLYRDSKEVFNDDYYVNNRKLVVEVRGFKINGYRLDMKVYFKKNNNSDAYKTSKTFELINFNMNESIANSSINYFENILTKTQLNQTNKLYYLKDDSISDDNDDTDSSDDYKNTGTVGDQIQMMKYWNMTYDLGTDRAYPDKSNQKYIRKYEFVYKDGYWWQLVDGDNNFVLDDEIGISYKFKKIDSKFSYDSAYEKGDIVIYNNEYYICTNNIINNVGPSSSNKNYYPCDGSWIGGFWRKAKESDYKNNDGTFKDGTSHLDITRGDYLQTYFSKTIVKKLDDIDLSKVKELDVNNCESISVVKDRQHPTQSEVYKITSKDKAGHTYQKYYIKLFNNGVKPNNDLNEKFDWQLISAELAENSAYAYNDVVFYDHYGQRQFIQCCNYYGVQERRQFIEDAVDDDQTQFWKKIY